LIDQFLLARQQGTSTAMAMTPSQAPSMPASFTEGNGASTVGFQQGTVAVPDSDAAPAASAAGAASPQAEGSKDGNGFWNWTPAAVALNERAWPKARVELEAASQKAGAASERAFANSALSVLAAPGGPLEGSEPALPAVGDLRVLNAGSWQLLVNSRLARFVQGVSVRLPGYRADGDSVLMDLTFDRGEFAPGTHFTRVSGEDPARVVDASGQPVSADEFYAPAGADYNIPDRELRLK
jgi:hypothetical protein